MVLYFHSSSVVTIGFDMTDYEVLEGDTVDLVVLKSGYIDSAITVRVFSPGLLDEQRTFEAGFEAPDNVTISLSAPDDTIGLEPDEVHVVTLSLVTAPGLIVLSPSVANVTIIDDEDCEWICTDNITDTNVYIISHLASNILMYGTHTHVHIYHPIIGLSQTLSKYRTTYVYHFTNVC